MSILTAAPTSSDGLSNDTNNYSQFYNYSVVLTAHEHLHKHRHGSTSRSTGKLTGR